MLKIGIFVASTFHHFDFKASKIIFRILFRHGFFLYEPDIQPTIVKNMKYALLRRKNLEMRAQMAFRETDILYTFYLNQASFKIRTFVTFMSFSEQIWI